LFFVTLILSATSLYTSDGPVTLLTKDTFGQKVLLSEKPWAVEFFAPWCGHCKAFAPEYTKAAENLKGIAGVGAVNCDEEKELCSQFKIQGFPTVKLFGTAEASSEMGVYVKNPIDYNSARSASSVVREVLNLLPDTVFKVSGEKGLERIKSANKINNVVILFSKKTSAPTLIKSLALDFKYNAQFFLVEQSEQDIVKKYEVTDFPSVIAIKKEGSPVKFTGSVKYDALFNFISKTIGKPNPSPFTVDGFKLRESDAKYDVTRIVSQDDFDDSCIKKKRVCFVAVLDPVNNDYRQEADEEILDTLAKKYAGRATFSWFGALEQPDVIKKYSLNSGFPCIFALYPSRERYAVHIGKFDADSVDVFVSNALAGVVRSNEFKELPKFKKINPSDFKPQKDAHNDDDDVSIDDIHLDDEPKVEL